MPLQARVVGSREPAIQGSRADHERELPLAGGAREAGFISGEF